MPGYQRTPQPRRELSERISGGIEVLGALPGASNATLLARTLADDGREPALVVYKPRDGEAPLWDFPDGTLGCREVAAFEIADALGWPAIPETITGEGPFGVGALQAFVVFDPRHTYFSLAAARAETFRRVAAFDAIVNNADRKAGHCLLGEEGRVWSIDHGICFAVEPKLRTVIWEFAGEPLPSDVRDGSAALAERLRSPDDPLTGLLGDLLTDEEVEAAAVRAGDLAAAGVFPYPDSNRPVPWPPI